MPPPGRSRERGALPSVMPTGSLLALTRKPAGGFTRCGISACGRISNGIAWAGCGCCTGSHSLPPVPLRMKKGGSPATTPAWRSSRMGTSLPVK